MQAAGLEVASRCVIPYASVTFELAISCRRLSAALNMPLASTASLFGPALGRRAPALLLYFEPLPLNLWAAIAVRSHQRQFC